MPELWEDVYIDGEDGRPSLVNADQACCHVRYSYAMDGLPALLRNSLSPIDLGFILQRGPDHGLCVKLVGLYCGSLGLVVQLQR